MTLIIGLLDIKRLPDNFNSKIITVIIPNGLYAVNLLNETPCNSLCTEAFHSQIIQKVFIGCENVLGTSSFMGGKNDS